MINSISSRTCGNVYSILTELKLFYKIPEDKQNYIINHKGKYECKFNKNVPLQFQIKDKQTMVVLSYLFIKYINNNQNIKKYLLDNYKRNEMVYQKELRLKYNPNDILKNSRTKNSNNTIINKELALVQIKENIVSKIIKKIKNCFQKRNK